jgi:hypothetical protein
MHDPMTRRLEIQELLRRGKRMKIITYFALLFALAVAERSGLAQSVAPKFEVGQLFPTLVLPSLDGAKPSSISDYRGKKVILHIFASW